MPMKLNKYLIAIGSNTDREKNINLAVKSFENLQGDKIWGETVETAPVNMPNSITFQNKCLVMLSGLTLEELVSFCKKTERAAGRKPEDKPAGKIVLDIDVVVSNGTILKKDDFEREYIKRFADKNAGNIF